MVIPRPVEPSESNRSGRDRIEGPHPDLRRAKKNKTNLIKNKSLLLTAKPLILSSGPESARAGEARGTLRCRGHLS